MIAASAHMDQVLAAARAYNIGVNGFWVRPRSEHTNTPISSESDVREVDDCIEWISLYAAPQKHINRKLSSYYLKHVVERSYGHYVSNGAFIVGALLMNYKFVRGYGPNAYFNIKIAKQALDGRWC